MKNFNKKIYALNLQSIKYIDSPIPAEYWKLAFNIANSFSKEYSAIGVQNINDLMQEGYLALFKTWKKIDWKYIVWVGGVDDYYTTYEKAKEHYDEWTEQGYDDVILEKIEEK